MTAGYPAYLAGDHMQLPALVSDSGKKLEYGRSIMQRLLDLNYEDLVNDLKVAWNNL